MEKLHWLLIALAILLTLTSCRCWRESSNASKTRDSVAVIVNKEYVHDSMYIDRWHTIVAQGDTIHQHDSTVVYKYIWRYHHDTVQTVVNKTDTAYVDKVITQEVKKGCKWWFWLLFGAVVGIGGMGYLLWNFKK